MSASTSTSTSTSTFKNENSFANAIIKESNYTLGDNGGVMKKSSNNALVDNFTNLNKETSEELIKEGIKNMLYEVNNCTNNEEKGEIISDIFKLWCHKRHAREGEKEKLLSYRYFLELYEYYPETLIKIGSSNLFGEIGYWKDYLLLWKMINIKK